MMNLTSDVSKFASAETGSDNLAKANEREAAEEKSEEGKKGEEESARGDSAEGNSVEKAATRIQAVFRGHRVRQSMKNTGSSTKQGQNTEPEPTKEQLEQEFREDDKGKARLKEWDLSRPYFSPLPVILN
jgi:hypothetical protein